MAVDLQRFPNTDPSWATPEYQRSQDLTTEDVMADVGDDEYPSPPRFPDAFAAIAIGLTPEGRRRAFRARQRAKVRASWRTFVAAVRLWILFGTKYRNHPGYL